MEGPVMVYHPDRHSESAASTEQHIADYARRLNEIFDVLKTQRRSFLMTSASTIPQRTVWSDQGDTKA
jgi:hypothetical protein